MENKYYTNRHYADTDKIRIAVSRMNRDIRELSKHCDRLEKAIDELLEVIEENLDEEVILNCFDMSIKEFIEYIRNTICR